MSSRPVSLFALLSVALLAACGGVVAHAPPSFAAYEETPLRAVSADGVVLRVRTIDHEPHADLLFWREAMKSYLLGRGYLAVSEEDLKVSGCPGVLMELAVRQGTQDYGYLIALFVHGEELVLVEATGEAKALAAHRQEIDAAVAQMTL